jgi:hypothetical protein
MGRFVTQRSHLFTIRRRPGEAAARGGGLSQGSETIDLADHEAAALPSNRHRMAYSDMTHILIFAFLWARRAPLPQRRCWRQAGFRAATGRGEAQAVSIQLRRTTIRFGAPLSALSFAHPRARRRSPRPLSSSSPRPADSHWPERDGSTRSVCGQIDGVGTGELRNFPRKPASFTH